MAHIESARNTLTKRRRITVKLIKDMNRKTKQIVEFMLGVIFVVAALAMYLADRITTDRFLVVFAVGCYFMGHRNILNKLRAWKRRILDALM